MTSTRPTLPSLAATLSCVAALAAAPLPKDGTRPISAKNVPQLRSVQEVKKQGDRIIRGPGRGELVILEWNNGAEIVKEATLRTVRKLVPKQQPTDVAFSPDGKLLTWTERGQTGYTVQDTASGKTFDIDIGKHPGRAAFSPDGKLLAIGYTFWEPKAEGVGHSEMRLFDVTGKHLRTLERNGPGALQPVFSPDGKLLAVGNRNYQTQLFDVATGKLLHTLDKRMTQEVAFSPDGKTLAAGYVDGTVALWDVATGKLLHSEASGCQEIYSLDWNPKGDVLATAGRGGKVVLWEPGKLQKLKELDAPAWVIQVRFTADGSRLLTSGNWGFPRGMDRRIVVWAVPSESDR